MYKEPVINLVLKDVICDKCMVVSELDFFRDNNLPDNNEQQFLCPNSNCRLPFEKVLKNKNDQYNIFDLLNKKKNNLNFPSSKK